MDNYDYIKRFNHMKQIIDNYLYFQSINLINEDIDSLKITQSNHFIIIDYFIDGKLFISLNLSKKYDKDKPSEFILSYVDENNIFIKNKHLCFNTTRLNTDIKKINQYQQQKLDILYNVIQSKIEPLNEKAWAEYQDKQKLLELQRKSIESEIINFDSVINPIIKYINYKNNGIVPQHISNLHITDNQNGVFVEILENEVIKGTLTFWKNYSNFDTRVFMVQYTDHNKLTDAEPIGYISNTYKKNTLRQPNEHELAIINEIKDVVYEHIIPLVDSIENLYKDKNFQYHLDK